ncbi:thioredoxin domain-containing protein [Candidatus Uabimicrobium sp. HlEnr_7]|uniref:thioredoxin domain-containing protein n=1 Tax=Candidatus Uabimicrobium helgolandensis TaxID=3095367 RepID=UPI003557D313
MYCKKSLIVFLLCLLTNCSAQNNNDNDKEKKKQKMYKNELAQESSPYLLQHKNNPVHWLPWGEKAFALAKERDVPIIISIGYSTCHWCHVMEHEVFEDEEAASLMNKQFVCIKVDREERPEVDDIYMSALHAMNQRGGWPLNVIVTPQGKPFFGGTFFPKEQWMKLLKAISDAWNKERKKVTNIASELTKFLQENEQHPKSEISPKIWQELQENLNAYYDEKNPAWGKAPKFPSSQTLRLVLLLKDAEAAKKQALNILTTMQDSGLHDLVGGGFHRYSTDEIWRVPHFEKMLYDNALLATAYFIAGDQYKRSDLTRTAERTLEYMLRDLRIVNNGDFSGYACAEDADDPGGEGSFYAWNEELLTKVVSPEEAKKLAEDWNLKKAEVHKNRFGHKEPVTTHIPFPRGTSLAKDIHSTKSIEKRLSWEKYYPALLKERETRPRPHLDNKVLTSWNGLALSAFAHGARLTQKQEYITATRELASLLLARHKKNGLIRLAGIPAFINDYGFLLCGLMDAFDALGDPDLIDGAIKIADEAIQKLSHEEGGFYSTTAGRDDLILRSRILYDNAYPSGNSTMALGLTRLWNVTGKRNYLSTAEKSIEILGDVASRISISLGTLLTAHLARQRGEMTIIVTGKENSGLLAACRKNHFLATVVDLKKVKDKNWPILETRKEIKEVSALFCVGKTCLQPAHTEDEVSKLFTEYSKFFSH